MLIDIVLVSPTKNSNILKRHTMGTPNKKKDSVSHIYIGLDFDRYCACITNKKLKYSERAQYGHTKLKK